MNTIKFKKNEKEFIKLDDHYDGRNRECKFRIM